MKLVPQIIKNLRNVPVMDRIFYVPFWECPFMCDFCCVDSLPGQAADWPDQGEDCLLALMAEIKHRSGNQVQMHLFGGEPLLRPDYAQHLAQVMREQEAFFRFYLYSTLRLQGALGLLEILGPEKLRIIVNSQTSNEQVLEQIEALGDITELYHNPVFFPTGRGRVESSGNQSNLWQNILPIGLPGRSCFAAISGMLVNGAHGTVHLCCLPQSPVVGTIDEPAQVLLDRYELMLPRYIKRVHKMARAQKAVHPCQVCEKESGFHMHWRYIPESKPALKVPRKHHS